MNKKIIINKFGGAIMSSSEHRMDATRHIKSQLSEGVCPIIVVSAFKGVTDEISNVLKQIDHALNTHDTKLISNAMNQFNKRMVEIHHDIIKFLDISESSKVSIKKDIEELLGNLTADLEVIERFGTLPVFQDKVFAYGEKLSSLVFAEILKQHGIDSKRFTGEELGIITDDVHLDANILFNNSQKQVKTMIASCERIPVITGFVGQSIHGQTTTLGRGGSDTTATFLGAALDAEKVILWKSVPGILSADPSIVKDAVTLDAISYKEVEESGKVICDKAMNYMKENKVPIEVAFIKDSKIKTTIVEKHVHKSDIKLINFKKELRLLTLNDDTIDEYGFLYRVSKAFNDAAVNMILIRNTRETLYIVANANAKLETVTTALKEKNINTTVTDISMITMIGSLTWDDVNKFNTELIKSAPNAILGSFPYNNNTRLEAIVPITDDTDLNNITRNLHNIFVTNK